MANIYFKTKTGLISVNDFYRYSLEIVFDCPLIWTKNKCSLIKINTIKINTING